MWAPFSSSHLWKLTKKRVGSFVSQKKNQNLLGPSKRSCWYGSLYGFTDSYANQLHFAWLVLLERLVKGAAQTLCILISAMSDKVSHNKLVLTEVVALRVEQLMDCSFNGQGMLSSELTRRESLLLMLQGNIILIFL